MTRELDEILWRIVDEGNEQALREFVARYPHLAEEATRRSRTAGRLRAARPGKAPLPAGATRPKRPKSVRRGIPAVVWPALAVGAIAFVGFLTVRPDRPRPAAPIVRSTGGSATFYRPPAGSPGSVPGNAPARPDRPETVLRNARLQDAIVMLASREGKTAQIAPGFGEERIDVTLPEVGNDALAALGERYGFTAFDQGDGTVLVIPAREGSEAQNSAPL